MSYFGTNDWSYLITKFPSKREKGFVSFYGIFTRISPWKDLSYLEYAFALPLLLKQS